MKPWEESDEHFNMALEFIRSEPDLLFFLDHFRKQGPRSGVDEKSRFLLFSVKYNMRE